LVVELPDERDLLERELLEDPERLVLELDGETVLLRDDEELRTVDLPVTVDVGVVPEVEEETELLDRDRSWIES
jgi:hypothetical protein